MVNLSFIGQIAYETLEKNQEDITPKNFATHFCKIAKEYDVKHEDCEQFEALLTLLEKEDDENFNHDVIHNIYELSNKLYAKHNQDKDIILRNTKDISKLLIIINDHLMEAISGNKEEVNQIIKIRDEIQTIKLDEHIAQNIVYIKDKLVDATEDIEIHMNKVVDKLEVSSQEVIGLKEKIKALENEIQSIKKEKELDHLTKVLTRKSYEREVRIFENDYIQNNQDYAIIFIDLDHFKNINDTYGHEGGDFVLKTFSQILNKLTRKDNIIGRYGGEEFVIAFRYFDYGEIEKYMSRIKEVFSMKCVGFKEHKIHVTFSAGIELRKNFKSYEETLSHADKLLYEAKKDGRNKIILPDNKVI